MPNPFDAYREGYERGRHDGLGARMAEVTMGMLRDDPGGYFEAGYYDGAAGKKFSPHGKQAEREATPKKAAVSTATDLEKSWYGLCISSSFIPKHIVDYYISALNAEGSHVAVTVGLHGFTGQTCPKCKEEGQFKIHFLGRLNHPECQWSGYMGTGSYIGFQLLQILHSGMRAGSQMKEDAKRPDDKGSSWIDAIFGFLFVGIFRAALAVVLIPLHTIVAVFQPGQSGADIAKRVATMVMFLAVVAFGVYKIQSVDTQRFQPSQPVTAPAQMPAPAPQTAGTVSAPVTYQNPVMRPSFDCGKARTPVELLICRDSNLASLENEMASTYHQTLNRLSPDGQMVLRRDHLAWFKNYSRTCNHSLNDAERSTCIMNYLSDRTAELKTRAQ